jgi:hypothetical protein
LLVLALSACGEHQFAPYGDVSRIAIGRLKYGGTDGEITDPAAVAKVVALLNERRVQTWTRAEMKWGHCAVALHLYRGADPIGTFVVGGQHAFVLDERRTWKQELPAPTVAQLKGSIPAEKVHGDCRRDWLAPRKI